jgi:hypothetical protein
MWDLLGRQELTGTLNRLLMDPESAQEMGPLNDINENSGDAGNARTG